MPEGKLLLVSGDQDLAVLLTEVLQENGYQVLTTGRRDAFQSAMDHLPDLVVLASMDAIHLAYKMRTESTTAHIPVILLSAYDNLQQVADTLAINDYLTKPFDLNDFLAVVTRWTGSA